MPQVVTPSDSLSSPLRSSSAEIRSASTGARFTSGLTAFILLMVGAAAAIGLAGGAEQGNLGVFLLFAGTALTLCPPRARIRWPVWLAAAFLGLCGAASLLPAHFFHPLFWRQALASVPDLPLPSTVSAAPAQTIFWLEILAVTLLTGLFTLTQPVRSRGLLGLALAAVGFCGVYAALSIFARLSGWHYPFGSDATFGFFPNRNHAATLLVTGSILAVGILGVAFRERRWLSADWAVAALTLCVVGLLFFSASRAGVLFLGVGVVGWVAGLGGRHRNRPLLLVVGVVVLVAALGFLFLKNDARDRLLGSASVAAVSPSGGITTDDRLRIYHDTLSVIRDAPLTGLGLGTFSLVFPPYRQFSANASLVLHPESDWLMVAAETGLPALACLATLVFLVLRGWQPARQHPYWPLRWAFLAAAGAAVLHGFVDVPSHRAALGWWLLVLAGLALQPGRAADDLPPLSGPARWLTRAVFLLGGLLAWTLGFQLVRAEWFGGPPLPPYVAGQALAAIDRAFFVHHDNENALEAARAAVLTSPLSPPLYFRLGELGMYFYDTEAEVDRAFRIQRLLNPWTPDVPQAQAAAWLPFNPANAVPLAVEALRREERLHPGSAGQNDPAQYWQSLVQQAALFPAAQTLLWPPSAERGPAFILAWLAAATPATAREHFPLLASDTNFLHALDPKQRQSFLALWAQKGDQDALHVFQEQHAHD